MADQINFTPYLGWVDVTDPNSIPAGARVIQASDLLRYENLGKDVVSRVNDLSAGAFPSSQAITYNPDGSVATVTDDGVTTSYTYNADGTVATDSRTVNGVTTTRNYGYTNGNLTSITKAA